MLFYQTQPEKLSEIKKKAGNRLNLKGGRTHHNLRFYDTPRIERRTKVPLSDPALFFLFTAYFNQPDSLFSYESVISVKHFY